METFHKPIQEHSFIQLVKLYGNGNQISNSIFQKGLQRKFSKHKIFLIVIYGNEQRVSRKTRKNVKFARIITETNVVVTTLSFQINLKQKMTWREYSPTA